MLPHGNIQRSGYQAFPGDALFSCASTCFFSAFTRSFSRAAFRNCWKASLDDFPEASATDWLASLAQESAFFRTISCKQICRIYSRTLKGPSESTTGGNEDWAGAPVQTACWSRPAQGSFQGGQRGLAWPC